MNFISKIINSFLLNREQKEVNKEFEENGLTDEVLEKQVKINSKRHKLDLVDPDSPKNGKWVQ